MAYCTSTQVQEEFKSLALSSTTAITTTQVDRFIAEADAEINSRLGVRYTTPITGTEALLVIRKISIGLVAQRIKDIQRVQGIEESKEQAGRARDLIKDARETLQALADGSMVLSDATAKSTLQGMYSYNYANSVEPTFEKGTDQW